MIRWYRRGYLYRLGYFRSITKKNDTEFELGLRDKTSGVSWHPNPVRYERDNFIRQRQISAISWKYR
jgi:hypothetical protein